MSQTGPISAEGRERSSRNAMKHGLCSNRMFVFDNESPGKWEALLRVWTDKLRPADDAELCIVLDIAHAQWKLRRARTYESGLMDAEMEEQAEGLANLYEEVDEGIRQASAFKSLADNSRSLDLLHRYETRARRAFERGLSTLEKLRATAPPATQPKPLADDSASRILPNEILPNETEQQELASENKNCKNEPETSTSGDPKQEERCVLPNKPSASQVSPQHELTEHNSDLPNEMKWGLNGRARATT